MSKKPQVNWKSARTVGSLSIRQRPSRLVPSGMKMNGFKNATKPMTLPSGRVSPGQMEKMDAQLLVPVPEGRSPIRKLPPSLLLPTQFPLGRLLFLPSPLSHGCKEQGVENNPSWWESFTRESCGIANYFIIRY